MNRTSRMTALLAAFRRERNGAVADAMRPYGAPRGLNYGVSLPTLRRIVAAEATDDDLARYLWQQDVRELRLAALHLARLHQNFRQMGVTGQVIETVVYVNRISISALPAGHFDSAVAGGVDWRAYGG